jgi:RNA polymerase sigma factor (sigma-70 family)
MANTRKLHKLDTLLTEWRESGSPDSFLLEVNRFAFRRVIVKLNRSHAHAEDIAAETMIHVWKHITSFDASKSSIATWVRLTIDARLNDYFSKHYQEKSVMVEGLDLPNIDTDDDHQFTDMTVIPESVKDIADSLMSGYTIKETAERLGVKPATLRKRLERVRNMSRFPDNSGISLRQGNTNDIGVRPTPRRTEYIAA